MCVGTKESLITCIPTKSIPNTQCQENTRPPRPHRWYAPSWWYSPSLHKWYTPSPHRWYVPYPPRWYALYAPSPQRWYAPSPHRWFGAQSLSCVRVFATLWTVAHQAPLSMGFSRQEYWSGLPYPCPGNLSNPGIESPSLTPPALSGGLLTTRAT